jgi:hypothetical protein
MEYTSTMIDNRSLISNDSVLNNNVLNDNVLNDNVLNNNVVIDISSTIQEDNNNHIGHFTNQQTNIIRDMIKQELTIYKEQQLVDTQNDVYNVMCSFVCSVVSIIIIILILSVDALR